MRIKTIFGHTQGFLKKEKTDIFNQPENQYPELILNFYMSQFYRKKENIKTQRQIIESLIENKSYRKNFNKIWVKRVEITDKSRIAHEFNKYFINIPNYFRSVIVKDNTNEYTSIVDHSSPNCSLFMVLTSQNKIYKIKF